MKVGLLQFFSWSGRRVPLEVVYKRALERVAVMDQSGYDCVWLAEHHFTTYSVCPSVHLMAMHIADRTANLRIGTAVSLAAFYHPLRLAEEVALLDVLSGGRVNWGAGRGFDRTEFTNFGVAPEDSVDLFRENVAIVLAAWRNERLHFQGKYHSFDGVEVLPKPLQDPHPPTWVAATSPDALAWAAAEGHNILMDPHSTHAEIAAKRESYRQGLEAQGHDIAGRELPVARFLAIASTAAEAERTARQGAEWTVASYAGDKSKVVAPQLNASFNPADPVQRYVDDVIIWGTPDQVIDKLAAIREQCQLNSLLCAPLSNDTFEQFTDFVLPNLER